MAYEKQTWNTQSYVNPTRMNHIEDGIASAMTSGDMALLGAKNLNFMPYYHGMSRTASGVTFTVNEDGSITTSGTATADANFFCHRRIYGSATDLVLPNGNYILTGCPSGGSMQKYDVQVLRTYNDTAETVARDFGNGTNVTLNGDDFSSDEVVLGLYINIRNGQNANGLTFKPMLRMAGDNDSTWTPFALTNKQLSDIVGNTPTSAGTYKLQLVVDSSGNKTYSWV